MSVVSSAREARAVLLAVDPGVAAQVVRSWGPVEALERVGRDPVHGAQVVGLSAGEILEAGAAVGAVLLTPEDEGWPAGLDGLVPAPVGVWVRGPVGLLAGGGSVVLVGAAGVDVAYPAAHAELVARVVDEGGVVVTVTSPGLPPSRARFTGRNRVMAALSRAVVVVEAAARSGVRDVAHTATMLGVPVGAVPGPVTSVTSAGCHQLLRDGAHLITCLRDVLAMTGEAPDRG